MLGPQLGHGGTDASCRSHQSACGATAPASIFERSSRSSTSRARRAPSASITSSSSVALLVGHAGARRAAPAVVIAVSGERRSCEIARRIAVRATSARFAASASAACSATRSRSSATSSRRPSGSLMRSRSALRPARVAGDVEPRRPGAGAHADRDLVGLGRRHRLELEPGMLARRVARASRAPMRSSCAAIECPARIVDATSASSVASRSWASASSRGSPPPPHAGARAPPAGRRRPRRSAAQRARDIPRVRDRELVARRDEQVVQRQHAEHARSRAPGSRRGGSRSPARRAGR